MLNNKSYFLIILLILALLFFSPLDGAISWSLGAETSTMSFQQTSEANLLNQLLSNLPADTRLTFLHNLGENIALEEEPKALKNVPIPFTGFIQNLGQVPDESIHYYYSSRGLNIGFGPSTIKFLGIDTEISEPVRFQVSFPGAHIVTPEGRGKKIHATNYLYGSQCFTNLPSWNELWYPSLYSGIDLRYYMSEHGLKYDFVIHPGANPAQISLQLSESMTIAIADHTVSIQPKTCPSRVFLQDTDLQVFQTDGVAISARFYPMVDRLNTYGFQIDAFDHSQTLIIDPVWLPFSTYVGARFGDIGRDIAVDDAGNVYVTGCTYATNFPTVNAYDDTGDGDSDKEDVFVFKLASDGSTLLYSTYVSGNKKDDGIGIAVDDDGNAYVTGRTSSLDFPTTTGSLNETFNGGTYDVF
ncbi:MAG: SBBP repeat-containing protein, partial [Candidatus Hermodarchaeota archaeon]